MLMFEWDEDKNRSNIAKHGISFDLAKQIFQGFVVTNIDDRSSSYGEVRECSIGKIAEVVFIVVIHTQRDGKVRIISARPANKKEREKYEQEVQKTFDS